MAVKFPLEVKNGVKARDISELKENFDIEKVIGYYLDGKLRNWLEARYYKEEAEAIEQLDENDTALAKKLCEIFGVEYEMEEIDHEEIARRNERLARIKQFTADEEIIKNVDFVAFDQEELSELYDIDAKKIFLCEGTFVIPKSKRELEYVLISNPEVIGLSTENEFDTKESFTLEKTYSVYDIPINIADEINVKNYIETEDYIVYRDGFHVHKFSKKDNSISEIVIPEKYKYMIGEEYFTAYGNNVIFAPYNQYSGTLLNYDLNQNKCKQVTVFDSWHGGLKERFADNGKLAYFNNEDVRVYDLKSGTDEFCFESWKMPYTNFIFFNNKLFVFEDDYYEQENGEYGFIGNVYYLDFNQNMKRVDVLNYKDSECNCRKVKFSVLNDDLYLILHQDLLEKNKNRYGFKVLKINLNIDGCDVKTVVDLNGQKIGFRGECLGGKASKYIPFVKNHEGGALYLLDLVTCTIKEVATGCSGYLEGCNSYQVVGNYLYYEKGSSARLYRVELNTGQEIPIK